MAELQRAVGAKIRELRMARGWSQETFADICEIHRSHMGEIERGEVDVAISTLAKLAKGLDITVSAMLKGVV
ncbi:MAG TPA: helix-turn-helix transcriptional regulator [Candidatus Angelobacter sp.]|jgi:transcriptional regulator with XRE-family HTH domain|nr:helix-turn-helix transcriptional regulator [Candidatus Angelobacter sp.]